MSFPYARTYDEVNLYMSLRPCVCGETEFEEQTSERIRLGALQAERFDCYCLGCARLREFTFQMSDRPREVSFEVRFGPDDEPSRLIDAGEWLAVSQLYGAAATGVLDEGGIESADELAAVYYTLTSAIAALDEVVKFIPDDVDVVPEGAFWTPGGRAVWEADRSPFTRESLAAGRERLVDRLAEFERRYGDGGDPAPGGREPGPPPGGGFD